MSFAKIPKVLLFGFEVLPISSRSTQTDPSLDASEYPGRRTSFSYLLPFGDGLVVLSFTGMFLCLVSKPSLIFPSAGTKPSVVLCFFRFLEGIRSMAFIPADRINKILAKATNVQIFEIDVLPLLLKENNIDCSCHCAVF